MTKRPSAPVTSPEATALFEAIRQDALTCIAEMGATVARLDWSRPEVYAEWLAQTYFYVSHATRVLARAASKCTLAQEPLHLRLLAGITEEQGHEVLALRDLRKLGRDISEFTEHAETSAYYQTLYHQIDAYGPFALPGYFLPLEGLAAVGFTETANRIIELYGKDGATFIDMHCIVDQGHFEQGLEALRGLGSAELAVIRRALYLSAKLYNNLLRAVGSSAQSGTTGTAGAKRAA